MIENRPEQLLNRPEYRTIVPPPYALDLSSIPELIKLSLLTLGGVQPLTREMSVAAEGILSDTPTEGEIDLFRRKNTRFQLIFVVISCVLVAVENGIATIAPFGVSLIPSSKRGEVSHSNIDFIASIAGSKLLGADTAYVGLDPFRGDWQLWGETELIIGPKARDGFMDEIGLVYDHYFLAVDHDPADVAMFLTDLTDGVRERYFRHRAKLLYTPFQSVQARRVWGVETPIELFVMQELAVRRCPLPQPQVMLLESGSWFPSMYDAWTFFGKEGVPGLISEADFFFPEKRIAVFCDGAHHNRRRQREKDRTIDAKLINLGIQSIRLRAKDIFQNLAGCVDVVEAALA